MAMEERARQELQRRLAEVLGEESALTLMAQLPRDRPATKSDVESLRSEIGSLRSDLEGLGSSLRSEFDARDSSLRSEIEGLGSSLRSELEARDSSLRSEITRVERNLSERIDLKAETSDQRTIGAINAAMADLRKDMSAQTRNFMFSTVGGLLTLGAVMVAALR